jgi:hypothetical protein
MDIQSLPVELQEKILVNITIDTKIELVCKLWNEICKKEVYIGVFVKRAPIMLRRVEPRIIPVFAKMTGIAFIML